MRLRRIGGDGDTTPYFGCVFCNEGVSARLSTPVALVESGDRLETIDGVMQMRGPVRLNRVQPSHEACSREFCSPYKAGRERWARVLVIRP